MRDGFFFVYVQLCFEIDSEFVYCEVRTEVVCNVQNFVLRMLNNLLILCNAW